MIPRECGFINEDLECLGCGVKVGALGGRCGYVECRTSMITDEEYGRAWAEMMKKEPGKPYPGWNWFWSRPAPGEPQPYNLTHILFVTLEHDSDRIQSSHKTESEAYAALGKAVREVHKQVPRLKGEQ